MITLDELKSIAGSVAGNGVDPESVMNTLFADKYNAHRFLFQYAEWNGYFGAGVAGLASKIARSRFAFKDPQAEFAGLSDRSVLVASYFFDAARDEFDDHETSQRDSHRDLAQATVTAATRYLLPIKNRRAEELSKLYREDTMRRIEDAFHIPIWLRDLDERVTSGYGANSPDTYRTLFQAMGYHLGSELLADEEFTLMDRILQERQPEMAAFMKASKVSIADVEHNGYVWISIHSGSSGAVEQDHFAWAMRGVQEALKYIPPQFVPLCEQYVREGFLVFARDRKQFFCRVGSNSAA